MSFPIIHANPEATPVPGQTAPFALTIVENYRSFFILHALFALADPRVTTMCFLFVNVFAIMLQFIEDEWPLLVDCIETGVIPHLENIELLRGVLEVRVC
jgi:auxin responsive GH3 family protein